MFKILLLLVLFSPLSLVAKETLTVYTYASLSSEWGAGPTIKKAFEAQCDCELKYVALADGVSLLNRLRMEGKDSKADVVLGLDNNLLDAAEKTGLFTEANVDASSSTVPNGWHNKTFIPYDYGWFAFIYDKAKLKNPPKSLKELVEGSRSLKIIYEDPRTSTPGLGLLLWMQKIYGDKSTQAWQKLAQKTITVTKGWSEAYGLFLKGESDMVFSYTTSPAYHLIEEKKDQYAAADFSEGHYLQVEMAAQLKSSEQPELAQKFMRFILTSNFQNTIAIGNWMYPAVRTTLPAGFSNLIEPKISLQFNPQEIASQRSSWINAWQRAVSH